MRRRTIVWFLFLFFTVCVLPATGIQKSHDINGIVVNVTGYGLLIVSIDQRAEIVRLADIVYPVDDERALNDVVEFTRSMVMNQKIRIHSMGKDHRGHILGRVYVADRCLNQELLTSGLVQPRLEDHAAARLSRSRSSEQGAMGTP